MKAKSLLLLRLTLGLLMVIRGLDKIVKVEHGHTVADAFYSGLFSGEFFLQALGVAQTALGLLIVVGYARKFTYPILIVITGAAMFAVWRSIVDPWGWFLPGTNVLFYPSVIIFAAALVLAAFLDEDRYALDSR